MTAHALLSASSSKRWLTCTPSARLEATLPEQKRGPNQFDFSQEGTMAHSLAEAKLRHYYGQIGIDEYEREYEIIKATPYYNDDFEANVDNYVLYVRSQIGEGDKPLFEQRVDFSDWVPDGFGTADVVILSKHSIRVIDLKFGKGLPVYALDNTQLRLYALGAYSKFKEEYPDLKEVEYTIHQPRLDSISTDGTTIAKLVDWANYFIKPKAKKAWAGSGEFIPGEHCQFCRAKATCRARSDFVNELAKLEFRPAPLLDDAELDMVLQRADALKSWASDIQSYVLDRAVNENVIPFGYKLSKSVTHRKIKDETLAAHVLLERGFTKDDIYTPPALKTISQLEKLGPKGQIASELGDLIVRPEGQPKLVRDVGAKEDFS
ncbi:Protein of unknown function DUF2800 [uncultured Caudovirales phage]|uniref:DUF2800 domain-containing protein n=1 Tax=uncultured Caudovirales phage TaxID=2100421 RepID=A0A6J7XM65_9CAUD|nr:Protein of unknown function DUF2800 [uncultured Caudovirales phage]